MNKPASCGFGAKRYNEILSPTSTHYSNQGETMDFIKDVTMFVIEHVIDACGVLAPRSTWWYWVIVSLVFIAVIGLIVYFCV